MTTHESTESTSRMGLLDQIRALLNEIGNSLNDDELTRLFRQSSLPKDLGFMFLSYASGYVTLCLTAALADNPTRDSWLKPEHVKIAVGIANKYGLTLYEPPDSNHSFTANASEAFEKHHYQFDLRKDTVVIAHFAFLKIRLAPPPFALLHQESIHKGLFSGTELLQDLSTLYQVPASGLNTNKFPL